MPDQLIKIGEIMLNNHKTNQIWLSYQIKGKCIFLNHQYLKLSQLLKFPVSFFSIFYLCWLSLASIQWFGPSLTNFSFSRAGVTTLNLFKHGKWIISSWLQNRNQLSRTVSSSRANSHTGGVWVRVKLQNTATHWWHHSVGQYSTSFWERGENNPNPSESQFCHKTK